MAVKCADCSKFHAHDVFIGACEMKRCDVNYDDVQEACEGFCKKALCKNCAHFTETGSYEGQCMGKIFAFPDLPACENYQAR